MAFLITNKINGKLAQNFCRFLSTKIHNKFNFQNEQNEIVKENNLLQTIKATNPQYNNKSLIKEEAVAEENSQPQHQRQFEVSETHRCVPLPLKPMKLSNPFPEPVKFMNYYTVSDDEKAATRATVVRDTINLETRKPNNHLSINRRSYSTAGSDKEKCPKVGKKQKNKCPKMFLPGCDPPNPNIDCEPVYTEKECNRQMAPYPSYSELCAEDPEYKPSECRMCPWKPRKNPNFKPPKRKLHTNSLIPGLNDEAKIVDNTIYCDLKKTPCQRPPKGPCPPKKEKKKPEKKPKKCLPLLSSSLLSPLDGALMETNKINNLLLFSKISVVADNKKSGPCKKFPFEKCEDKQKRECPKDEKCPKKKKPPLVKDCPGEKGQECSPRLEAAPDCNRDDKKKCPDVNLNVYKEEEPDRCVKKKKPEKNCPSGFLEKHQKKKR